MRTLALTAQGARTSEDGADRHWLWESEMRCSQPLSVCIFYACANYCIWSWISEFGRRYASTNFGLILCCCCCCCCQKPFHCLLGFICTVHLIAAAPHRTWYWNASHIDFSQSASTTCWNCRDRDLDEIPNAHGFSFRTENNCLQMPTHSLHAQQTSRFFFSFI